VADNKFAESAAVLMLNYFLLNKLKILFWVYLLSVLRAYSVKNKLNVRIWKVEKQINLTETIKSKSNNANL
jgi:hypothetical protein